jgi:adenylate kinase family enzyme
MRRLCRLYRGGVRIAVVGSSCSGKTTLARRLAERLNVPHVELDALHHGPNWTEAPRDEFRALVREAISGGTWVVDGSYHGKLGDLVLEQADLVVWIDLPMRTILPRLLSRTLDRIRNDVELWNGNRETWRGAFLSRQSLFLWVVKTHRDRRRRYETRLARYDMVRLRSSHEAEAWFESDVSPTA